MSTLVPHRADQANVVLIVDEDPDTLDELRSGLQRERPGWQVAFADDAADALAEFDRGHVDVIVTDVRVPGMDGATLLERIQERSPSTIRILLSGHADSRAVARSASNAHRFLAKPCGPEALTAVLDRSLVMAELSREVGLYRSATAATSLPSCPGVYHEIAAATADPMAGASTIASIIERDTAMTAKVLQLANSAYFGVGRRVNRVREAVTYLGTDTLAAMAVSAQAFAELQPTLTSVRFSIDDFQRHAMLVARLASTIVRQPEGRADAVTAAVLHDVGVLVLLREDPWRWEEHIEMAEREELPLHLVEQREQRVDHAAIGGYLLGLWGLPHVIVEAVANHHQPGTLAGPALDAVAAVHIADAIAHEIDPGGGLGHTEARLLDEAYVATLGVEPLLEDWREAARRMTA